jgi:hypothetical protein
MVKKVTKLNRKRDYPPSPRQCGATAWQASRAAPGFPFVSSQERIEVRTKTIMSIITITSARTTF